MGIFHGHPTTHRDPATTADTHAPTPPRTRGVVNGQSRGRISHARCARRRRRRSDGSLRRHSATGRRDAGDASERGGVRTRRDRSSGRVPTVFVIVAGPADAHHTRRASNRRHQGDARVRVRVRIASHPSIHRFDACVTSTRREVRARARTCECVKKGCARGAHRARRERARWSRIRRRFVDDVARCRRCVDVVAGFDSFA